MLTKQPIQLRKKCELIVTFFALAPTSNFYADTTTQTGNASAVAAIDAGKNISVVAGPEFTLQGSVNQPPATIKLTLASYLSSDNTINPKVTLPSSQNFVFNVSNEHGCKAKNSVSITVLENLHIPNAFSLNGDGINDVWNIAGLALYKNAKTQVLERWGIWCLSAQAISNHGMAL